MIAVLVLCAPYVYGAIGAFPIWDDGWTWLLIRERGEDSVAPSFADRELNAVIWSWLAARGAFFPAGFVAQATFWPLLGGVAALIWIRLYPHLRRFAAVAACLAVAPFATKVQLVTVNVALASLPPVLLAYAAVLLVWRFVRHRSRAALLGALPVLTLGILWQEYAVPVALIGVVLLGAEGVRSPAGRRRAVVAILVLAVIAAGAYALFFEIADPVARLDTHPAHALEVADEVHAIPGRLAVASWRVLVGGLVASVREQITAPRFPLAGLPVGALLAGLLLYGIGAQEKREEGPAEDERRAIWVPDAALLAALVVGILPILIMGRTPWDPADGMTSRFGIPLLPVAAAILTRLLAALRRVRLAALAVALVALSAGSTAVRDARAAVEERRLMTELGETLRPHVARHQGFTVAVIPLPPRALGVRRPWELTARLSADWPLDLGRRLWAHPYIGEASPRDNYDARRRFGPRESCRFPARLRVNVRHLTRRGRVHTLAWLAAEADGSIVLEPYCRKP